MDTRPRWAPCSSALDDATTASIVAFLESLTGEVPAHYAPPSR